MFIAIKADLNLWIGQLQEFEHTLMDRVQLHDATILSRLEKHIHESVF